MIRIINYLAKLNKDGNIISIVLDFKHIRNWDGHEKHPFITAITVAFCEAALLKGIEEKSLNLSIDLKNENIAHMEIKMKTSLPNTDIGDFVTSFQQELNKTS